MGFDQIPGGSNNIPSDNLARKGGRNEQKIIEAAKVERQQEYEEAGRKSVLKSVTTQNINPEGTVTTHLTTTAVEASDPVINTGSSMTEDQLNDQAVALQKALNQGLKDAQASRNKVSNDLAGVLDSMKSNTSADLSLLEARVENLLEYVQSPNGFGQSQLEGFQNLQKELESYGPKYNSSNMTTLPPYETNEDLVACKYMMRTLKSNGFTT